MHTRGVQWLTAERGRIAILIASYAGLAVIAFLAYITVQFYVGTLSVIPILFISYYLRPWAAIATAVCAGVIIGVLNANLVPYGDFLNVSPAFDILVLSLALAAIVIVARRVRESQHAAERDPLTGIVNRRYFMRKFDDAARRTQRLAIIYCDLDRFKDINDRDGHAAGDEVLRMAASRLAHAVRAIDTVARIGGDEFAILVPHLENEDEARHMAANIERAFADPFKRGGDRYTVGLTSGIAFAPEDGKNADQLLRVADARMYQAKAAKRASRGTVTYAAADGSVSGEAAQLPRQDA